MKKTLLEIIKYETSGMYHMDHTGPLLTRLQLKGGPHGPHFLDDDSFMDCTVNK